LKDGRGRNTLEEYFRTHAEVARRYNTGFVLESATWRTSTDWGRMLGYTEHDLAEANREAIDMLAAVREELKAQGMTAVISGCVGPRGDGYDPKSFMSTDEAQAYHAMQIGVLSETDADMVTALTTTYVQEAIGIARAAKAAEMPCVISFTVETDGRLPSGMALREAIEQVDAATDAYPAYYMINCAHPTHFDHVLEPGEPWTVRIRGIRANASTMSHAELDEAEELDAGDPEDLAARYAALRRTLAHINVLGGCCGTDHGHIHEIGRACAA
jgi:S-methylmethionine-dependent homocysteine/selenocysteine methylase